MFPLPEHVNLASLGPALLFVHVDWCPHCVSAKPTLERVAQALGTVVPVFAVDGEERRDVAKALGVTSFPTIVFIDAQGKKFKYEGPRTFDALTSFVCHNSSERHEFCKAF